MRQPGPEEKQNQLKMGSKLSAGARFVGKKMLNAVRATNTVRFLPLSLQKPSNAHGNTFCHPACLKQPSAC